MAFDLTKFTNLFEDIGSIIKAVDAIRSKASGAAATDVKQLRDNVHSVLNANSTDNTIRNVTSVFDNSADNIAQTVNSIADLVSERLRDQTTVLDELGTTDGADMEDLLREIHRAMVAAGVVFEVSITSVPATATPLGTNYGPAGFRLNATRMPGCGSCG